MECENKECEKKTKNLFLSNNPRYKIWICRECKLKEDRLDTTNMENTHPKDCKGCPDCPGTYVCKCGKSFDELDTKHNCSINADNTKSEVEA